MKVKELSGLLLDYWVARAEGHPLSSEWGCSGSGGILIGRGDGDLRVFGPSVRWEDAGPIIERERIELTPWNQPAGAEDWEAKMYVAPAMESTRPMWGRTALIAAMRAFVASKFGDVVPDGGFNAD